jgi:hypothetical protein
MDCQDWWSHADGVNLTRSVQGRGRLDLPGDWRKA